MFSKYFCLNMLKCVDKLIMSESLRVELRNILQKIELLARVLFKK